MNNITYRFSSTSDVQQYLELRKNAIQAHAISTYSTEQVAYWVSDIDLDKIERALDEKKFLLAFIENKLIGAIAWTSDEIKNLYVHPEYFGQNIGSALMQKAESNISSYLIKISASDNARGFYERCGYTFIEPRVNEDGSPYSYLEKRR